MNKLCKPKRIICILLAAILTMINLIPGSISAADREDRLNRFVSVDGGEARLIKTFDFCYEDAVFVSLKGMAAMLRETRKAFSPTITSETIDILLGTPYDGEYSTWTEEEMAEPARVNQGKHETTVNDEKKSYYSVILKDGDDGYDAYMTLVDLAMIIDADMSFSNETISINSNNDFYISAEVMEETGYLQGVNSLLIGDTTTGEIFYEYDGDDVYPIASTTKLMTYYIMMEAISDGYISFDDSVTVTKKADALSDSIDGVIPMIEGTSVPLTELVQGMLLASSNECALSIAIHTAEALGAINDEDYLSVYTSKDDAAELAFVRLMNEKATELSMDTTVFYNPHGLPVYPEHVLPAKRQNRMSAEDMFKLVTAIFRDYPQITDITSTKVLNLKVLGNEVKNTNGLLYNIPEVNGLKTGTTNKSGACLITSAKVAKNDGDHNLAVVMFGAEGSVDRTRVSELSVRYGIKAIQNSNGQVASQEEDTGIPTDPEKVVEKLIKAGLKRQM